jgi:hypothetical protein
MSEFTGSASEIPQSQWDAWQSELQSIGTSNPLLNFEASSFAQIDLERSHPGGFSQFVTGGQTLLSNLVRDPLAFSRALSAARRIKAKADRLSNHFGIESLHLAGGLADFSADGFDIQTPILMWPVSLNKRGDDYEIALAGPAQVNPLFVESLSKCYSINLNQSEVLARQNESSDLVPVTVLNYLANLTTADSRIDLRRILVISNFTTSPGELLADFERKDTNLLRQLVGEPGDGLSDIEIPQLNLVVDADATQMRIVARALAGQSFAVETLPGCGYLQTAINVLSGLVLEGKRVLLVAPRRQTVDELTDRLASIGLAGLAVRSNSTWVDVISAISRNEKAKPVDAVAPREKRIAAEKKLDEYFVSLNQTDSELGVSIARVFRELSALSAMPHPPLTNARIPASQLLRHLDRREAIAMLSEAEELGEFRFGPQDTAWYQARFESPAQVEHAIKLAQKLRDDEFPELSKMLSEFTQKVNFKPADTVEDWGIYLELFIGIRETLDKFVPDVFDRPLTELIAATAPRKGVDKSERSVMSGANRRRLKKLAKEYLRPGMHTSDMHASLVAIQHQREQWKSFCELATAPQVPLGIADAQIAYRAFVADLEVLQSHLDAESDEPALVRLPLNLLKSKLNSLAEHSDALLNLGERSMVSGRLREAGLDRLARDLGKLHASKQNIAVELEQAWWQSALEVLVSRDESILGFSPELLEANEENFRIAYDEQIQIGAGVLAAEFSVRWHNALNSFASEAASLKALLKTGKATFAQLQAIAPSIWPIIAPALITSPYEVPAVLDKQQNFDVVMVLDAAGSTVAENLAALRRGSQVIAFGDDAISAPTGFEIEPKPTPAERAETGDSVFEVTRRVFGAEILRRSYRTTSQTLAALINREFYQNRITYIPSAAEYFGETNFFLDVVSEGNRAKTTIEGATESLDAEVERVVELVLNHALWHPDQSLLVASASQVHAERIRAAVLSALHHRPELAEFFEAHGREKFEVAPIGDLTLRVADRVIFSIGFGRTSHGAVLSNFGQLSESEGRRNLANLLVGAKRQITVVSCFGPEDVPTDRMSNGALLLAELLTAATSTSEVNQMPTDPMLADLGLRLKKLGARVEEGYSKELPLIVAFAKNAVVIEPDWSIPGANRTERFKIRPGLIQSLGWKYQRVFSFELFSDPQALALRIAESLGMQVSKRPLPLFDAADRAFEDTDAAWGERTDSNDARLRQDKPPHWG